MTDEVYEHLVFDGSHVPLATLPGMGERTLTISSGGKTFSFTGWKVGWVSGPAPLVAAVRAAKQFLTYTSPAPFQLAVARGPGVPARRPWAASPPTLAARRDQLCDGLEALGYEVFRPAATYFATTDIAAGRAAASAPTSSAWRFPGRCGVVAIPSSVFYDAADPERRADAGALGLLQAGRRPGRRAGPLSIVGIMTIPITWVDAFSDVAFGGNPAAVCLLREPLDDGRMQSIAFELGIAETAYLTPTDDPTTFGLRWFSPAVEIDLCGHATLASAHALRDAGTVDGTARADLPHPQRPVPRRLRRRPHRARLPGRPRDAGAAARLAARSSGRAPSWPAATPTSSPSWCCPRPRRSAPTSPTWPPSPRPGPGRSC